VPRSRPHNVGDRSNIADAIEKSRGLNRLEARVFPSDPSFTPVGHRRYHCGKMNRCPHPSLSVGEKLDLSSYGWRSTLVVSWD